MSAEVISKRELSKLKRKETIIDKAEALFLQKGIDNTTMNDIAKEAGIGVATLFRYFPKKEIIILTVATEKINVILHSLQEIERNYSMCMDRLTAVLDFFIDHMTKNNAALPKLLDNFVNYSAVARDSFEDMDMYTNVRNDISQVFIRMIEETKSDGSVRNDLSTINILSTILSNFSIFTFKLSLKGSEFLTKPELSPKDQLQIMKTIFIDYLKP